MEFSNPFQSAQDLYESGILQKKRYLAIITFFANMNPRIAGPALIHLLFEELINPITYNNFTVYFRSKLNQSFDVLSNMGKYNDILLVI